MKRSSRWVILLHVPLLIGVVVMLFPLLWMISTSVKSLHEAFVFPPVWIPTTVHWENFRIAFVDHGIGRALFNSLFVAGSVVVGQIVVGALAAYAFARLEFWGRDLLFLVFLATMMIPIPVYIIPLYTLFGLVGWLDTYQALILPDVVTPFGIFLLRQFFMTVPRELEEAVLIDGGGRFRAFISVALPLSKPALAALAIFAFIGSWNDLFWPLVAISDRDLYTIPIALALFSGEFLTMINLQMAGATIATIPIIIVFLLMQRHFIKGVVMSGLKG